MSKTKTPAQALEAIQQVYDVVSIKKAPEGAWFEIGAYWHNGKFKALVPSPDWTIDWPLGVYSWPPPEPKWRPAVMPQDYGKKARFSDRHPLNKWTISKLAGYCADTTYSRTAWPWVADNGSRWAFCEVED
jgi:hypothetical protein